MPAAGRVLFVSVMPSVRRGEDRREHARDAPFGPASDGSIRTPLNRISSIPIAGASSRVTVCGDLREVSRELERVQRAGLSVGDRHAGARRADLLDHAVVGELDRVLPENSSLSALAAAASAVAAANAASAASRWNERDIPRIVPVEPSEINRISVRGASARGRLALARGSTACERGATAMAIYEPIEPRGPGADTGCARPVDREPIGELECMTGSDVAAALERARKAQPAWAAVPIAERAALLRRVLARVLEDHERITRTVIRETGKTETEAFGDGGVRELRFAELLREERRALPAAREAAHPRDARPDEAAARRLQAARRGRHHRALERPVRARDEPGRTGDRGRQRGAAQGLGGHALLERAGRRVLRRGRAARRRARDPDGRRPDRRGRS